MLKYDEFKTELTNRIKDYVPKEFKNFSVEVTKVTKVNESLEALCLIDVSKKVTASPIIYIDLIYGYYLGSGDIEASLKKAASIIAEGYNYADEVGTKTNDIKDNIVLVAINAEANKELLKTIPHIKFLDLAIIFRWILRKDSNSFTGAIVNNNMAQLYNLNTDELYNLAKANTLRLFPPKIEILEDSLMKMKIFEETFKNMLNIPVLVLSNDIATEGAAYIAYDEILKIIRDKLNKNFYILPASINEVLIIPEDSIPLKFLKNMVQEINRDVVRPSERLSDNVYFYDGRIRIV